MPNEDSWIKESVRYYRGSSSLPFLSRARAPSLLAILVRVVSGGLGVPISRLTRPSPLFHAELDRRHAHRLQGDGGHAHVLLLVLGTWHASTTNEAIPARFLPHPPTHVNHMHHTTGDQGPVPVRGQQLLLPWGHEPPRPAHRLLHGAVIELGGVRVGWCDGDAPCSTSRTSRCPWLGVRVPCHLSQVLDRVSEREAEVMSRVDVSLASLGAAKWERCGDVWRGCARVLLVVST